MNILSKKQQVHLKNPNNNFITISSILLTTNLCIFLGLSQQSNAAPLPVYEPYAIPDISGPFALSPPLSQENWNLLKYLSHSGSEGIGGDVTIRQGSDYLYGRVDVPTDVKIEPTNEAGLSFSQLNNSFTEETYDNFLHAFWTMSGRTDVKLIRNKATKRWIHSQYYFVSICGGGLQGHWTLSQYERTDGALKYKAYDGGSGRLYLREQGDNHSPYTRSIYNQLCASGGTITDHNKFEFTRARIAGVKALSPLAHFKFDQASGVCDTTGQYCGVAHGGSFGDDFALSSDAALYFNNNGEVVLPKNLLQSAMVDGNMTISFWMKSGEFSFSQLSRYPSQDDNWLSSLYVLDSDNHPVLGVAVNDEDTQIAFLKTSSQFGEKRSWFHWLTAAFKQYPGTDINPPKWVYVVLTVKDYRTQIYTVSLNNWLAADWFRSYAPTFSRFVTTRFNFFKTDLPSISSTFGKWGMGLPSGVSLSRGTMSSIEAVSDLSIFDTALEDHQVRDLINAAVISQDPIF